MCIEPFAFLQPHDQIFFKFPAAFLETILCVDNKWYELTTYQIFSKNSAWNLQKLWLGGVEEKQMGWCQLKYRLIDWFSLATSSLLWLFFFLKKNFVKSKSCSFNLLHVLFLEKNQMVVKLRNHYTVEFQSNIIELNRNDVGHIHEMFLHLVRYILYIQL